MKSSIQSWHLKWTNECVKINKKTYKDKIFVMKILHTADLHLGSPMSKAELAGDAAITRRNELTETFRRMADYASENGVGAFIIAGDLFDTGRVPRKTVRYVADIIAAHSDVTFFYLCGNHDGGDLISLMTGVPENLRTFGSDWTVHRIGEVVFCGKENPDADMYADLELDGRDFNIVVLHGQEVLSASAGDEMISLPLLAGKNIDYLALGHLHSFRVREIDARGLMCYPGCPEGRGFDECGEKGFTVIDTCAKKDGRVTFVPFAKRALHEVRVQLGSGDTALSRIREKIDAEIRDIPDSDMVKVILEGEIGADAETDLRFIGKYLSDRFFFAKAQDRTKLKIDPADYAGDVSLKGEMIRTLSSMDTDAELARDAALAAIAALRGEDVE